MKPTVDLVVPCFNPPHGWEVTLLEQFERVKTLCSEVDVKCILVNDGSTSGVTMDHIKFLRSSLSPFEYVPLKKNRGKGFAIRHGFDQATASIVGFTDVDFPYEPTCLRDMYENVKANHADIMIGMRDARYYEQIPVLRRWLSKVLRRILKLLLNLPVEDTQSGLKLFNVNGKTALLNTTVNGYLFDIELIQMAHRNKLRIKGIPLTLRDGIELNEFSMTTLIGESLTLLKLLFNK